MGKRPAGHYAPKKVTWSRLLSTMIYIFNHPFIGEWLASGILARTLLNLFTFTGLLEHINSKSPHRQGTLITTWSRAAV